jgi:hypothetical protein
MNQPIDEHYHSHTHEEVVEGIPITYISTICVLEYADGVKVMAAYHKTAPTDGIILDLVFEAAKAKAIVRYAELYEFPEAKAIHEEINRIHAKEMK